MPTRAPISTVMQRPTLLLVIVLYWLLSAWDLEEFGPTAPCASDLKDTVLAIRKNLQKRKFAGEFSFLQIFPNGQNGG